MSRKQQFQAKVRHATEILDSLGLVDRINAWPDYREAAKEVRDEPYRDEWSYYETHQLFDVQLTDGAIFQFKDEPEHHTDVSFCFYESPLDILDYSTFVAQSYGLDPEEAGDIARPEYEEYVSSAGLKQAVTMIRYDHSPGLYTEGVHPASHVHIGHGTNIRIGTSRVMNPVSFTLFVLRQAYPRAWERLIASEEEKVDEHVRHIREALEKVSPDFLREKDAWEVYLG